MNGSRTREIGERAFALLLVLGAAFMFGRTLVLVADGSLAMYTWWAAALLLLESLVDLFTLGAAARWLATNEHRSMALRATVAVVLLHALRVAIFVLGRTGPLVDFDIRPERRVEYASGWTWAGVYFAATMAAISVVILGAVWLYRRSVGRNRTGTGHAGSPGIIPPAR